MEEFLRKMEKLVTDCILNTNRDVKVISNEIAEHEIRLKTARDKQTTFWKFLGKLDGILAILKEE